MITSPTAAPASQHVIVQVKFFFEVSATLGKLLRVFLLLFPYLEVDNNTVVNEYESSRHHCLQEEASTSHEGPPKLAPCMCLTYERHLPSGDENADGGDPNAPSVQLVDSPALKHSLAVSGRRPPRATVCLNSRIKGLYEEDYEARVETLRNKSSPSATSIVCERAERKILNTDLHTPSEARDAQPGGVAKVSDGPIIQRSAVSIKKVGEYQSVHSNRRERDSRHLQTGMEETEQETCRDEKLELPSVLGILLEVSWPERRCERKFSPPFSARISLCVSRHALVVCTMTIPRRAQLMTTPVCTSTFPKSVRFLFHTNFRNTTHRSR
jgi:hypothetical protein